MYIKRGKRGETSSGERQDVVRKRGQSRGQVTIFIIIAILIIAAVSLYLLVPGVETGAVFDANNPGGFINSCLKDQIEKTVDLVSLQGGSIDPEFYFLYQDNKIEYLCYTAEYYLPCKIQRPLLIEHIESEIEEEIRPEVTSCFNSLVENYESRGYNVNLQTGRTVVELLPKRIVTRFDNYVLTVTKGETARHDSFLVILNNNLYELTRISNDIIDWEATYGDFDTLYYMTLFSDLKIDKWNQLDGSTIYIITDRNTEDKFQFASRSVAWPPGYGEVPIIYGE